MVNSNRVHIVLGERCQKYSDSKYINKIKEYIKTL